MSSAFGQTMVHQTVRGFDGCTEQEIEDLLRKTGMNRHEAIRQLEALRADPKSLAAPISAARSNLEQAEAKRSEAEEKLRAAFEADHQLEVLKRQLQRETKFLDRGVLQLEESRGVVEGFDAAFEEWTFHEENSVAGFGLVSSSVNTLLIHRELVARLPAWIEKQRQRVAAAEAELKKFSEANGYLKDSRVLEGAALEGAAVGKNRRRV